MSPYRDIRRNKSISIPRSIVLSKYLFNYGIYEAVVKAIIPSLEKTFVRYNSLAQRM